MFAGMVNPWAVMNPLQVAAPELHADAQRPHEDAAQGAAARQAERPSMLFDPMGYMMQTVGDVGRGVMQEGFGGLNNMEALLDRQQAQRELAQRFVVRGDGEAAAEGAASNNVSPEEFQAIARQYSDIRRGNTDLQLDTANSTPLDADRHRQEMMGDIGDLLQTKSGRELVGSLADQKDNHKTTIRSSYDNTQARGGAEAGSVGEDWFNGKGTNAYAEYMPGEAGGIQDATKSDSWMPMRSDVTLFHELTHAYHATRGDVDDWTMDRGDQVHDHDYNENSMEYQAVGLGNYTTNPLTENAYRAERRGIGATDRGTRGIGGDDDVMANRGTYNPHARRGASPSF